MTLCLPQWDLYKIDRIWLDRPSLPVLHDPAHVVDGTVSQVSSQKVAHKLQIQREHSDC